MKRYQQTFVILSTFIILLFVSIITVLSSYVVPDTKIDFKIPIIKTDKQKSPLCLSPQYMMNAWYDIECISPFCDVCDQKGIFCILKFLNLNLRVFLKIESLIGVF